MNATPYNQGRTTDLNQSYPPYFLTSVRDQAVREGESVLFEVVVSGKYKFHTLLSFCLY